MTIRKHCGAGPRVVALGGIALSGLLGTTILCGSAAPALAGGVDQDTLDVSNLERISDGSMQNLRGGFMVGGFDISFGVTVTTTVNGATVLQTSFDVNNPGQISNLSTQQNANSTPNLGSWTVSPASDGSGVTMTSSDMATTIMQHYGNGTGFNTDINNTANNRSFSNTTDLNLFLNNSAQVSAQSATSHLLTNLNLEMAR